MFIKKEHSLREDALSALRWGSNAKIKTAGKIILISILKKGFETIDLIKKLASEKLPVLSKVYVNTMSVQLNI